MRPLTSSLAIAAVALLASGCGGGSGAHKGAAATTAATTASAPKPVAKPLKGLPRPVQPHCGVAEFPPATIQQSVRNHVLSWTLNYALGPSAPRIAGHSTRVLLTELPTGPPSHNGHALHIAGRTVRLQFKSRKVPYSLGTWETSHARYVVLDDAPRGFTVRRLVPCLP